MKRLTWLLAVLVLGTVTWANAAAEKADDDGERTICFSKQELGKAPKGWTVDQTGTGKGSVWKVIADKTSPSKTGYVLAQTAESSRRVFNLCVIDDSKYNRKPITPP